MLKEGFTTMTIKLTDTQHPSVLDPVTTASTAAHHWYGDPVGPLSHLLAQPLSDGFHALFLGTLHYTPIFLVIAGMVLFMMTILVGKGKPYSYGLMCWGLSALVRVISHEFGI